MPALCLYPHILGYFNGKRSCCSDSDSHPSSFTSRWPLLGVALKFRTQTHPGSLVSLLYVNGSHAVIDIHQIRSRYKSCPPYPPLLRCCKRQIEICMAYEIKAVFIGGILALYHVFFHHGTIRADCSQLIAYSSLVHHQ